jgi:orotate phosphoribosyltransferase
MSRDRLKQLFRERALQFGDFTLASGKKSAYYVNSKKVLFHAEAITLLGELLYEATADLDFQAIGGLEVGAIPMAAAGADGVPPARAKHGRVLRPQAGEGARQQGAGGGGQVTAGDRVVVIDDVLTTGGSVVQAIEAVEGEGGGGGAGGVHLRPAARSAGGAGEVRLPAHLHSARLWD